MPNLPPRPNAASITFNNFSASFFANQSNREIEAKTIHQDRDFRFLLEKEIDTLTAILKKKREGREAYVRYSVYCRELLEQFNNNNAYWRMAEESAEIRAPHHPSKKTLKSPVKISSVIATATLINGLRTYWFFSRSVVINMLLFAKDRVAVEETIKTLESPNDVLKELGIDLFWFTFALHFLLFLKHLYYNPSVWESELRKRGPKMLSDAVWGIISLIIKDASIYLAGYLVAGFLFFDFCWYVLICLPLVYSDYHLKKNQLEMRLALLTEGTDKEVVQEQLKELKMTWVNTYSTLYFNSIGALLICAGFSLVAFCNPGIFMAACYAVALAGTGMYMSANAFGLKKEAEARGEKSPDFIQRYLLKTCVPTLLLSAFVLSWQITVLVLMAAVIAKLTADLVNQEPQPLPALAP